MKIIDDIKRTTLEKRYNITRHARKEMSPKEDDISEKELIETILNGGMIEDYPDDKPFPSCLILGRTKEGRTIHSVCAYSEEDEMTIIITAYEPIISRWIDYKYRR